MRHIVLDDVAVFDAPDVRMLTDLAIARAKVPLDPTQARGLIIKSISAKQRPRRPKGR